MKTFLIIIGTILSAIGFFQGYQYIMNYSLLSAYGKGFIWGNIILVVIGIGLILIAFRKTKKK